MYLERGIIANERRDTKLKKKYKNSDRKWRDSTSLFTVFQNLSTSEISGFLPYGTWDSPYKA